MLPIVNVYSRPWTMRMTLHRRQEPNARLLEYECFGFLEHWEDR